MWVEFSSCFLQLHLSLDAFGNQIDQLRILDTGELPDGPSADDVLITNRKAVAIQHLKVVGVPQLGEKMQILNTAAVLGLQAGVLDGTEVR